MKSQSKGINTISPELFKKLMMKVNFKNSLPECPQEIFTASLIIYEFNTLRKVWQDIRDAKNVVNPQLFPNIEKNIKELQKGVIEQDDLLYQLEQKDPGQKRSILKEKIQKIIRKLFPILSRTKEMISKIKVKIDEKIKTLENVQKGQPPSIILNFAYAGFYAWNVIGGNLIDGVFAASHFGLGVGNTYFYYITDEILDELRKKIQDIDDTENMILSILEDKINFVDERLGEL